MDALTEIRELDPNEAVIRPLLERHLRFTSANSPACSVHTLNAEQLASNGVRFFAAIKASECIGMGALKRLSGSHGELKSMHIHSDHRGRGLADQILASIIKAASEAKLTRLFLETGSQQAFEPARRFYLRNGFELCPPFEGYKTDPASVFMTRKLN